MKFKFAPSLPAQLEPSTFYMIAKGEQFLEIHVTNADASAVRRVLLKEDLQTTLDAIQVTRHTRDSRPGDVWYEWVSNTELTKKFHGLDGVIRAITETYA